MVTLAKVLNLSTSVKCGQCVSVRWNIWMEPTPDIDIKRGYRFRLRKSLYGLKQAPKNWFHHINEFVISLGFKQTVLDTCLYVLKCDGEIFIIIAGSILNSIRNPQKKFTESFDIKDFGEINQSLSMKITR